MSTKNSLIAKKWEEGKGDSFPSYNPENQEKLAGYKGVNTVEIDAAV